MKKQATLFAIIFTHILLLNTAYAQGVALSCKSDSPLFPKQKFSKDTTSLDITADKSEVTAKDNYLLTGNVELTSSEYYLAADTINVSKSNKTSNASGNVKFQNSELMLTADTISIKKQDDITHTLAQKISYFYPNTRIRGQAQKISDDGIQQNYKNATYSVCPTGDEDWQIKADNINLNASTNRGVAENVTFEIFGVPVFYSPNYEWILEGRESGFLSPNFGSYNELYNNKGLSYRVRIPYYFNIAPDRDFLLSINYLSTRGSVVEGVYRQLIAQNDYWQGGRFEIEGHYLDKDDITNKKRWLIDSELDLSINDKIDIALKVNRVSDKDYLEDIAHNNVSQSSLRSEINTSYKDENDLTLSLFAESEQLVNNGTATYTRAPELLISKNIQGLDGRTTQLSLISTNFQHKNKTKSTGVRTHTQVNFKRLISTNAYSIIPSLSLFNTNYNLDNKPNQNRTIGTFNIDSKLFLERETSIFGNNLVQTFTPRLAYRYTPQKIQNALPNFDSAKKNSTYESLFSGQDFTGLDRISSANNFTLGLESEFIDQDTGETYLSFKSAQTFYIDNQGLGIDGKLFNHKVKNQRKYSNIAATVDLKLGHFTFNNALQFNPKTNKLDEQDNAITYNLSPRKFITLAYHDDKDINENSIKSAEVYVAYPITQKIHIFGGVNRTLNDGFNKSLTDKKTAGIAYESCCWALRLAHFKEHIGNANFDRTTSVELVFKNLISTSPDLAKRLEESIPNYLANLND